MNSISCVNVGDGTEYLMDIPSCVVYSNNETFDNVIQKTSKTDDGITTGTLKDSNNLLPFVSSGDDELDALFDKVADEVGIDVNLLRAVAKVESSFDPLSTSSSGAMGLMQLMPFNCDSLEIDDPYDPYENITGGAKMLAYLLDDYNYNISLALAAYNAGSGAVNRAGGVPDTQQATNYVRKVNNVLGGILDNDSWTIEGSQPTVISKNGSDEYLDEDNTEYNNYVTYYANAAKIIPMDNYSVMMNNYTDNSDNVINSLSNETYNDIMSI